MWVWPMGGSLGTQWSLAPMSQFISFLPFPPHFCYEKGCLGELASKSCFFFLPLGLIPVCYSKGRFSCVGAAMMIQSSGLRQPVGALETGLW